MIALTLAQEQSLRRFLEGTPAVGDLEELLGLKALLRHREDIRVGLNAAAAAAAARRFQNPSSPM